MKIVYLKFLLRGYLTELCLSIYQMNLPYFYVSQVGIEPPLIDDTSYEADALTTEPPRPAKNVILYLIFSKI